MRRLSPLELDYIHRRWKRWQADNPKSPAPKPAPLPWSPAALRREGERHAAICASNAQHAFLRARECAAKGDVAGARSWHRSPWVGLWASLEPRPLRYPSNPE